MACKKIFKSRIKNLIRQNLVDSEEVLLPHLYVKLGLMIPFVKALNKTGNYYRYLNEVYPHLLEGKIKEDMFVDPNVRQSMKDEIFEQKIKSVGNDAWVSFKDFIQKFLGN